MGLCSLGPVAIVPRVSFAAGIAVLVSCYSASIRRPILRVQFVTRPVHICVLPVYYKPSVAPVVFYGGFPRILLANVGP